MAGARQKGWGSSEHFLTLGTSSDEQEPHGLVGHWHCWEQDLCAAASGHRLGPVGADRKGQPQSGAVQHFLLARPLTAV